MLSLFVRTEVEIFYFFLLLVGHILKQITETFVIATNHSVFNVY